MHVEDDVTGMGLAKIELEAAARDGKCQFSATLFKLKRFSKNVPTFAREINLGRGRFQVHFDTRISIPV